MKPSLAAMRQEWRGNRRLRIASGLALLIAILHFAAGRGEARRELIASYQSDRALLARLEAAAADAAWPERAQAASAALAGLQASLTAVAGAGEAQAEMQALLAARAAAAGLTQAQVRTEGALAVEGLPGLLLVAARIDASSTPAALQAFLGDLAGLIWVRVEQIEIRDGNPGQVRLVLIGYYRVAGPDGAAP